MLKWLKVFLCLIIFIVSGCTSEVNKDEARLEIKLNTEDDIGLLLVDYTDDDGYSYSGGISNADGSLLKKDELDIFNLYKDQFHKPEDTKEIAIQFRIVTKYIKPNYENEYPSEYTVTVNNTIHLDVVFGETYTVEISGNKTDGYEALLK